MAAKIILKKADVEVYRNISANFNQERFDAFAFEVQQTQLRELLNDALYYKLYNDLSALGVPQNAPYINLVDGTTYEYNNETIQYFGLKPFLVYHWLSVNLREGDLFQSEYGNIQYSDNPQDNMTKSSQKTIDAISGNYMKNVTSYRNNITRFLNENQSDYEEWISKADNKNKSGFGIFTV